MSTHCRMPAPGGAHSKTGVESTGAGSTGGKGAAGGRGGEMGEAP